MSYHSKMAFKIIYLDFMQKKIVQVFDVPSHCKEIDNQQCLEPIWFFTSAFYNKLFYAFKKKLKKYIAAKFLKCRKMNCHFEKNTMLLHPLSRNRYLLWLQLLRIVTLIFFWFIDIFKDQILVFDINCWESWQCQKV